MESKHPKAVEMYGYKLEAIGLGNYPYECDAKDDHPKAMVYKEFNDGGFSCWTHSECEQFKNRDKSKDIYKSED